MKNTDLVLKQRRKKEIEDIIAKNQRENFKYTKPKHKLKPLIVKINDVAKFVFSATKNKFVELQTVPSKLNNYQLYSYFLKLEAIDVEELNIQHYLITKNEMIKRGLIMGKIQPLNDTTQTYGF
ncbi:MAG: hypothetical protein U9R16_03210 [Campylobacterota bacterium]|nr:hypothetical protein [Campylobacterota bacterium]